MMATYSQGSREASFAEIERALGFSFSGEIRVGGNYVSVVQDGNDVYVSGQIPRVGDAIVVTGRVGAEVSLAEAQLAAKVCAMRALAVLRQALGTLSRIRKMIRMSVYIQSAEHFTQQSEVADGASEVLLAVLGSAGLHTRTSVGVFQLPKNAAVEIDFIASVD